MNYGGLLRRQRAFFSSGGTMRYSDRIQALAARREALVYYEKEISQALIGAIAAGKGCVVKPSELAPHTSDALAKVIACAFPEEHVAMVLGGREESEALLEQRLK